MPKKHVLLESESDNEESFNDERLPSDENDSASVDVESVDMDEYLRRGGECGRYQIWVVTLITITVTPLTFPILIFYYIGHDPMWSCVNNATSTFCKNNTNVYEHSDKERCSIPRSEWMYHTSGRTTFATEVPFCRHLFKMKMDSLLPRFERAGRDFIKGRFYLLSFYFSFFNSVHSKGEEVIGIDRNDLVKSLL